MGEETLPLPRILPQPPLALGVLACAPLFLIYEVGLGLSSEVARNGAERFMALLLRPFGALEAPVRWLLVGGALVGAYVGARRYFHERDKASEEQDEPGNFRLRKAILRLWGEGLVAGLALGPLLVWLLRHVDGWGGGVPAGPGSDLPVLGVTLRLFGAAVWEELFFRVGVFGLIFLFVSRVGQFFGLAATPASLVGDFAALLGSALFFATFHLAAFQRGFGGGGDPYEPTIFFWRLGAGILLAALFRWRGLGVAAYAHGIFNLGLALGAGPGVFE